MIQLSYESNVYLNFKIVVKCLLGNRVELSVSLHYYEAEHAKKLKACTIRTLVSNIYPVIINNASSLREIENVT